MAQFNLLLCAALVLAPASAFWTVTTRRHLSLGSKAATFDGCALLFDCDGVLAGKDREGLFCTCFSNRGNSKLCQL